MPERGGSSPLSGTNHLLHFLRVAAILRPLDAPLCLSKRHVYATWLNPIERGSMVETYLLIHDDGTLQTIKGWRDEFDDGVSSGALEVIRFRDGFFEHRMPSEAEQPSWERI